jgi:hypothetical protein
MIQSGRAVALDCYAIGKSVEKEDKEKLLFKNDMLNKSVLLKRYEPAMPTDPQSVLVNTVVYFPYDMHSVYDGGESVNFSDGGFHGKLAFKIAKSDPTQELLDRIGEDMKFLNMFDSMHSLDPFLFKTKAEQLEIDSEVHPAYFAISDAEWEKIKLPIRDKISKLVSKALDGMGGDTDNLARQQYVERFLTKIWEAKDVEGIEPFIKAMQIQPENAPEVFFAWKAVCYYQVRFTDMLNSLKALFQWVGHNKLCCPMNHLSMLPDERRKFEARREGLREKMREGYIAANRVIAEYEESYNKFVEEDKPNLFMNFLDNSENSYLSLASHVSVATHSLNLWHWYVKQYGKVMRNDQFNELFEGLTTLHGVQDDVEAMAWVG